MSTSGTQRPDGGPTALPAGPQPPVYDSKALLRDGREIFIRHAGETYRLRVTRQNKLILTK